MGATELLRGLLEATVVTSLATILVLGLRRPLRAAFGARVAYAAWALVPAALLAVLLPAAPAAVSLPAFATIAVAPAAAHAGGAAVASGAGVLVSMSWVLGVVAALALLATAQRRFRRSLGQLRPREEGLQAESSAGLPATMGWPRPAIVLPSDFDSRYDASQRALMLAHERMHIARGDLHANAFAAALRCLFWFNPLLHLAARTFRHDQELACDACVVAGEPASRRVYGEALLQAQFAAQGVPLACHFGFGHPLKERIAMLKESLPSPARRVVGGVLVSSLVFGAAFAAWAAQPPAPVHQDAHVDKVSTPAPSYAEVVTKPGVTGKVMLIVDVAADGSVAGVQVESAEPADAVSKPAVIAAVSKWRFTPALKDGKPVPSRVRVPIWFEPTPQQG